MHTEIKERVTMPHIYHCPTWLKNAVFYEIYPQSFQDSNADGIGDIQGIISRLDYVRSLGTNALWINPIFDSPFKDAGYDVRNYEMVAPRYGTNADLIELFNQAHARGMHVLLDLVPGHTSEEHPWFTASKEADPRARTEFSERYIWTDPGSPAEQDIHSLAVKPNETAPIFLISSRASLPSTTAGHTHNIRGNRKLSVKMREQLLMHGESYAFLAVTRRRWFPRRYGRFTREE